MIRNFNELKFYLREDLRVNFRNGYSIKDLLFNKRVKLLIYFRLSMFLINKKSTNIILKLLLKIIRKIVLWKYNNYQLVFNIEISPFSNIREGLYLPHPNGIIIHPKVVIGKYCTILQQVTIGNNPNKGLENLSVIGDNVVIGAGAKIIGPCKIGNNVVIGANAVVVKDISSNKIVAGVPAKVIRENKCL